MSTDLIAMKHIGLLLLCSMLLAVVSADVEATTTTTTASPVGAVPPLTDTKPTSPSDELPAGAASDPLPDSKGAVANLDAEGTGAPNTVPAAGEVSPNNLTSPILSVTDQMPTAKDEVCNFLKNGYFRKLETPFTTAELKAAFQQLIPSLKDTPIASYPLTDDDKKLVMDECPQFAPKNISQLLENVGGDSSQLFGVTQGFDFDLLDVQKKCPGVISNALETANPPLPIAPQPVLVTCLTYFTNEILPKKYLSKN